MSTALRDERAVRLRSAMSDAGLDVLLLAGDAWRSDYMRYALDITPMEGRAIALISRAGKARWSRRWSTWPSGDRRTGCRKAMSRVASIMARRPGAPVRRSMQQRRSDVGPARATQGNARPRGAGPERLAVA